MLDTIINWFSDSNNTTKIVALITLIGVIFTLIANVYIGKKSIKANVISKARIEWIQKERDYLSEYMSLSANMYSYYKIFENRDTRRFLKHSKYPRQFQNLKNILIMSLGPDDGTDENNNDDFIELITNVYNTTQKTAVDKIPNDIAQKHEKELKDLTEFARKYFKNEWNKAKKGK